MSCRVKRNGNSYSYTEIKKKRETGPSKQQLEDHIKAKHLEYLAKKKGRDKRYDKENNL